jgi:hypothetical protein
MAENACYDDKQLECSAMRPAACFSWVVECLLPSVSKDFGPAGPAVSMCCKFITNINGIRALSIHMERFFLLNCLCLGLRRTPCAL